MRHLKENNVTYLDHMKLAFSMARYGFKLLFFGVVHGIFPCFFHHSIRITVSEAYTELSDAINRRNINFYEENK